MNDKPTDANVTALPCETVEPNTTGVNSQHYIKAMRDLNSLFRSTGIKRRKPATITNIFANRDRIINRFKGPNPTQDR